MFSFLHPHSTYTVGHASSGSFDPTYKPTALAYQLGARYVLPWSGETKHVVGAEYTHVDPWTYNRWQPYLTMYQGQLHIGSGYRQFVDYPLGYTAGADLNRAGLYYRAVTRNGYELSVSYPVWKSISAWVQGTYSAITNFEHEEGRKAAIKLLAVGLEYRY